MGVLPLAVGLNIQFRAAVMTVYWEVRSGIQIQFRHFFADQWQQSNLDLRLWIPEQMFRTTHTNDTSESAGDPAQNYPPSSHSDLWSPDPSRCWVKGRLWPLTPPPENNKIRMSDPSSHNLHNIWVSSKTRYFNFPYLIYSSLSSQIWNVLAAICSADM